MTTGRINQVTAEPLNDGRLPTRHVRSWLGAKKATPREALRPPPASERGQTTPLRRSCDKLPQNLGGHKQPHTSSAQTHDSADTVCGRQNTLSSSPLHSRPQQHGQRGRQCSHWTEDEKETASIQKQPTKTQRNSERTTSVPADNPDKLTELSFDILPNAATFKALHSINNPTNYTQKLT